MNIYLRTTTIFLLTAFVLLPFAQEKIVVWGVPLYLLEGIIIGAAISFALHISTRKDFVGAWDPWALRGILLILFGITASFLLNPFSLTGLGMLKSWLFFPVLAFFLFHRLSLESFGRVPYLVAWLVACIILASFSGASFLSQMLTFDGRLFFPYNSPNFLAVMVAPGMLLSAFFFLEFSRKQKRSFWNLLCLLLFLFFSCVLFGTRSYGTWIATGVSLLFLLGMSFWEKKKKFFWLSVGSIIVLVLGVLFVESGSAKWHSLITFDERSSASSRIMIWNSAVRIGTEHPFFGIGIGRFQEEYLGHQKYFPPYLEWAVPQPHNIFLAFWLQGGVLGLIGFLVLLWRSFLLLFQDIRKRNAETFYTSIFLFSALLFFVVYGLFDTPYFKNDLAFLFWALIAFSVQTKKLPKAVSEKHTIKER